MARQRGRLLLKIGIGAALVGLGISALGAYSVSHTSHNVAVHQNFLDRLKAEGDDLASQPRNPQNRKRLLEIPQEQRTVRTFLDEYEGDRDLARVILAGGLFVLIAGGVCVAAHYLGRPGRSPGTRDERDEDEPRRRGRKRPRDDG